MCNIVTYCPGCKKTKINENWQKKTLPAGASANPQLCPDCREDKYVTRELLNEGFDPAPLTPAP